MCAFKAGEKSDLVRFLRFNTYEGVSIFVIAEKSSSVKRSSGGIVELFIKTGKALSQKRPNFSTLLFGKMKKLFAPVTIPGEMSPMDAILG